MNKSIGLDVGSKTIGVALSDAMGWTAQGLTTLRIDEANEDYGIEALKEIIETNNVTTAVIGLPKNMNNTIGPSGEASLHFSEILKSTCPELDIIMWDERLSTVGAERSLLEADVSRKKRKQVIDKMAAVFILQGYLNSK
ncbi:Holliday junction resolvase RuvX [Macrococcoides caseolyticum]|uniref:Holliday junction resolvase RuvX n=1 Tax=Macrococcoides caseolyticum TaxID=69966 RepID=UPI000C15B7FF|nr:Holliday junction resolvase RuvX [Macrococcus caseolyticus]MBQ5151931.1 Holliday junction resolvase RuvX [Macrococcus caseolyticus]MDJ1088209.1 Holliday junction resolvase RuvX [Macrococcus caseolyticus]MDJ1090874.1 Holliday junction resolvase RuvX [Macrococcus caseolyticus]MDJ1108747.1 Holliday junction resolvase RuvX [Macrococcus caseolyticus]MDJ1152519.1 Holliday junction resolvase RuvX [Macrococcus caseolyticus]